MLVQVEENEKCGVKGYLGVRAQMRRVGQMGGNPRGLLPEECNPCHALCPGIPPEYRQEQNMNQVTYVLEGGSRISPS
jgi:hypothetical protein